MNNADNGRTIIVPLSGQKINIFIVWKQMLDEHMNSRELTWRLFLRDFLAGYKQSMLGVGWIIIMPLLIVGAFIFLNRSGVLNIGQTSVPYPLFALTGLSVWQVFASGIIACTNCLISSGGLITKINFPKESLVFSSLAQTMLDFIIRIVPLAAAFVIFGVSPHWTVLFLPLLLIPLLLLTLGLGFLFSFFNAIVRDIGNAVSLLMTFLLFVTPVLYPAPDSATFVMLNRFNVPGILVTSIRDFVLTGAMPRPLSFICSCIVSVAVFVVSWTIFHLTEPIVAERI